MPKLKTKKAVAKRFKVTGRGKILRSACGRGHLFTGKARKRKRRLRRWAPVSPGEARRVAEMWHA